MGWKWLQMWDAYQCRQQSSLALQEGDIDKAIHCLSGAIASDPNSVLAYYERGQLYVQQKKIDSALADFNQVINLEPNHVEALLARARIKHQLREPAAALHDLEQATAKKSNYGEAWQLLGLIYQQQHDHQKAINCFTQALAVLATSHCYSDRGLSHYALKQWTAAHQDFAAAVSMKSDNYDAWYGLGKTYLRRGHYSDALRHFSFLLFDAQSEFKADVQKKMAYCYAVLKQYNKALAELNSALSYSSTTNAQGLLLRALCYYRCGSDDEKRGALKDLMVYLHSHPKNNRNKIHGAIGLLYLNLGNFAAAVVYFTHALEFTVTEEDFFLDATQDPIFIQKQFPKEELFLNRGIAYYKSGYYKEALADMNQALVHNRDYVQAFLHRIPVAINLGDGKQAVEDMRAVLRFNKSLLHQVNTESLVFFCSYDPDFYCRLKELMPFSQRMAVCEWGCAEEENEYLDQITGVIMDDPVTLSTGHTYDRDTIKKLWDNGTIKCPNTQVVITMTEHEMLGLSTNWRERKRIGTYVEEREGRVKQTQSFRIYPNDSALFTICDKKESAEKTAQPMAAKRKA